MQNKKHDSPDIRSSISITEGSIERAVRMQRCRMSSMVKTLTTVSSSDEGRETVGHRATRQDNVGGDPARPAPRTSSAPPAAQGPRRTDAF
ncbi:Hypothetical protein NTJ_12500 [Nesidiocoris tenuis]|uniref:Uncharacterized protein n=1 Tax=Nesidiocoris tenuis TaxID=355587 RepID=A0ABN7B603_9HEMI|nr:Hypothetical protein NTJ_12500 [Nesidiocoris tenuis]